ncbi:SRPBCC family protein [Paramicrobacterium chengjingii]|uniref:SRPBCC family protein n=1 Tax=Paramicrobacterium chengjingii TaxID=2769067 RepID=A0ABX6YMA4_9MICO|nr:SRPBCC family protein [Microbacterium chengjingii]QPZ39511.1 SRPBCC family protein [Microbacterium chengjingii]
MTSTFTLVTDAPVDIGALFEISLDIDAHASSMSQSGEQAISGVTSGRIGLGETVTWRARHFGIWFAMTSEIVTLERPELFVDQQAKGPFKLFRHEHRFERRAMGTRMTDTITLASPVFGRAAECIVLVPYLRRLIIKRNTELVAALS